jgi:hypothetical protein
MSRRPKLPSRNLGGADSFLRRRSNPPVKPNVRRTVTKWCGLRNRGERRVEYASRTRCDVTTLADCREPQQMLAFVAKRDTAILLKLLQPSYPQFRFGKRQIAADRAMLFGLHAGRTNDSADHVTRRTAGGLQHCRFAGRGRRPASEMHRVERPSHDGRTDSWIDWFSEREPLWRLRKSPSCSSVEGGTPAPLTPRRISGSKRQPIGQSPARRPAER